MKVCDLDTGLGRLTHAFAQLKERWADTKTHWNDETGRQFEKDHLTEIASQVRLMLGAVQRLSDVLAKAESECADREVET